MGQWGRSYEIEEWEDGVLYRKKMLPHYPSPAFTYPAKGTLPDKIVCIDKREISGNEKEGQEQGYNGTE